jgi:hypothetical protein
MRRQQRRNAANVTRAADAIVPKELWDKTQHALAASAVIKKFDTSLKLETREQGQIRAASVRGTL